MHEIDEIPEPIRLVLSISLALDLSLLPLFLKGYRI
jgi:hypothetical protein